MTGNNDCILRCKDIYKSYQMGVARLDVLRGISLSVRAGEFVAIMGASGSGKSTLLHILGGLDTPDRGSVFFREEDIARFSARKINKFRNQKIGFVFQFYHLLDELTVLENVLLAKMAGCSTLKWLAIAKSAKNRACQLLGELGLSERLHHKPFELSGGERQRVAIARAMMNQPDIILADEPTGNLDSETGNGILNIFRKLHSAGQTIIMVSHDEKIARTAQRVIRLVDGKITTT